MKRLLLDLELECGLGVALRVLAQGIMAPSAARRGKAPARAFGVGPEAQDGRRGYGRGHPLRVRAVKSPAADAAGRGLRWIGRVISG